MGHVNWNGDKVLARNIALHTRRLRSAAVFLQGAIKEDISQAGTLRYSPLRRKGTASESRKMIDNFTHSLPGNPPSKQSGRLRSSIAWEIVQGKAVSARVGTNVKYGRYLELGTRCMKARPFLRPALAKHQAAIRRIVAGTGSGASFLFLYSLYSLRG